MRRCKNCVTESMPRRDRCPDESTCGGDCSDPELRAHAPAGPAAPSGGSGTGLQGLPHGAGRQPTRPPGHRRRARALRRCPSRPSCPGVERTGRPPARPRHRVASDSPADCPARRCCPCCARSPRRSAVSSRSNICSRISIPTCAQLVRLGSVGDRRSRRQSTRRSGFIAGDEILHGSATPAAGRELPTAIAISGRIPGQEREEALRLLESDPTGVDAPARLESVVAAADSALRDRDYEARRHRRWRRSRGWNATSPMVSSSAPTRSRIRRMLPSKAVEQVAKLSRRPQRPAGRDRGAEARRCRCVGYAAAASWSNPSRWSSAGRSTTPCGRSTRPHRCWAGCCCMTSGS